MACKNPQGNGSSGVTEVSDQDGGVIRWAWAVGRRALSLQTVRPAKRQKKVRATGRAERSRFKGA